MFLIEYQATKQVVRCFFSSTTLFYNKYLIHVIEPGIPFLSALLFHANVLLSVVLPLKNQQQQHVSDEYKNKRIVCLRLHIRAAKHEKKTLLCLLKCLKVSSSLSSSQRHAVGNTVV